MLLALEHPRHVVAERAVGRARAIASVTKKMIPAVVALTRTTAVGGFVHQNFSGKISATIRKMASPIARIRPTRFSAVTAFPPLER